MRPGRWVRWTCWSRPAGPARGWWPGERRSQQLLGRRSRVRPIGAERFPGSDRPTPGSPSSGWRRPRTGPTAPAGCSPATGPVTCCTPRCTGRVWRPSPRRSAAGDGLELFGVRITAPVHCAPPDNKPTPGERDRCAPFLSRELELLGETLRVVVVLGAFGWQALLAVLSRSGWLVPRPRPVFGHGAEVVVGHSGRSARDPAGQLPREPAEHLHRPADAGHAGRRAGPRGRAGRRSLTPTGCVVRPFGTIPRSPLRRYWDVRQEASCTDTGFRVANPGPRLPTSMRPFLVIRRRRRSCPFRRLRRPARRCLCIRPRAPAASPPSSAASGTSGPTPSPKPSALCMSRSTRRSGAAATRARGSATTRSAPARCFSRR